VSFPKSRGATGNPQKQRLPPNYNLKKHAMKRKLPVSRFLKPRVKTRGGHETWHNGADVEIHFYARSLQRAAKALVEKLESAGRPGNDWDVCPIIAL
jgi:hypothetical protein